MFNVAVVNIKDIFKYLVSITITLCIVMFCTRFFSNMSNEEKYKISGIMQTSLLLCLDEIIPAIKETNNEINNSEEELIDEKRLLGNLLKIELAMFEETKNTVETQIANSNKIEENKEPEETKNQEEIQSGEISRKCYYRGCDSKSFSR